MSVSTDSLPALRSHERAILQPWFNLTGLDEASPEWRSVWMGLISAQFAGEHGLTLWPAEGGAQPHADTVATQTVRLALVAGAHYGLAFPDIGPGEAVALVLEVLRRDPEILATALDQPPQDAVQQVLVVLSERIVGVFPNARSALASQVIAFRSTAAEYSLGHGGPWEALVDLVLDEAVNDDVFAEHVLLQMDRLNPKVLDVVVLPDGQWVVLRPGLYAGADTL